MLNRAYVSRYKEAQRALEKEVGPQEKDEMSLAHRLETTKGVVQQLVENFAAEGDPQLYVDAYDRLVSWVDNALDIYRVRCCMHGHITPRHMNACIGT